MRRGGFLDTIDVADLLRDLGAEHATGTLRVDGKPEIRAYFIQGDVYYAERESEPPLDQLLVEGGVITATQREQLGVSTGRGRYLGRALDVASGIDKDAIRAFVRERTMATLELMLRRGTGRYVLQTHEHHPAGVIESWPVGSFLGILRTREEPTEQTELSARAGWLRDDLPSGVNDITLSRDEWRVVAGLCRTPDVTLLAPYLGMDRSRYTEVLRGLNRRHLAALSRRPVTPPGPQFEPEPRQRIEAAAEPATATAPPAAVVPEARPATEPPAPRPVAETPARPASHRMPDMARPRTGAMEPAYAGVATMRSDPGDDSHPQNSRKRALQRLIESIRGA
jgi:hypothetical protein